MVPPQEPNKGGGVQHAAYSIAYDVEITDEPQHEALLAWWLRKRGDAPAPPPRSALDPAELRAHLGSLALIEQIDEGRDYRFRLIGTNITEAYGRDSTGKSVRELYSYDPTYRDYMLGICDNVTARAVIARGAGDLRTVGRDYRRFDTLLLPMTRDDGSVGWILNQLLFS